MMRFLRRHGWSLGLFVLLGLMVGLTNLIQPGYGASGLESLARAALPFAFAASAQAVVVIVGGVDLSVASMMAVTSVTAAALMERVSPGMAAPVVALVLVQGACLGAVNGTLVVLSRVPDIVVTLAMLFVWEGVALMILGSPGGAAADWLEALLDGHPALPGIPGAVTRWVPNALIVLAVLAGAVWLPIRRSRFGLAIYAVGSDQVAAFRTGVPVAATRIGAYAVAGLFAGMGGLALTLATGIGAPIPGPYLLASVAAVVLGGVVLGGGKGGLLGPIVAVFILRLVRTILTFLSVDPNVTTIIEGTIMVAVVMAGGLMAMRRRAA